MFQSSQIENAEETFGPFNFSEEFVRKFGHKGYASQGVSMQHFCRHAYFSEIFFTYSNMLKFLYRAVVFQK